MGRGFGLSSERVAAWLTSARKHQGLRFWTLIALSDSDSTTNRRENSVIRKDILIAAVSTVLFVTGCQSASEHAADVQGAMPADQRLTVGTVQREIHVGMMSADVIQVLGSPNIVTTDEKRREVWVYDKIATDTAYSESRGGVSTLILGGALIGSGLAAGAGGANYQSGAGASSTSQRTLTIVIKYDNDNRVRDFAYHTSRF